MSIPDVPALERPSFFDGQRLVADDFSALFAHPRAVRWLHNQVLHGWGIGAGFDVVGKRGDRFVTVKPGYALDCVGHDLVLSEDVTLAVPQSSGGDIYLLTISYMKDGELPPSETRDGTCLPLGAIRRPERPLVRWQTLTDSSEGVLRPGIDVVLCQVAMSDCKLAADPDRSGRRDLVQRVGPYVAHGIVPAEHVKWSAVQDGNGIDVGVSAPIDTASAGFRRTPVYFPTVLGARVANSTELDGPLSVSAAKPTSFTLTMSLQFLSSPTGVVDLVNAMKWAVGWVGIEV